MWFLKVPQGPEEQTAHSIFSCEKVPSGSFRNLEEPLGLLSVVQQESVTTRFFRPAASQLGLLVSAAEEEDGSVPSLRGGWKWRRPQRPGPGPADRQLPRGHQVRVLVSVLAL